MITGNNYRQKFNHINPIGATFFVTFRLHGSLPKSSIDRIKIKCEGEISSAKSIVSAKERNATIFQLRKKYLVEFDDIIDSIKSGPHYLTESNIAKIIKEQLHKHDGSLYNLICYSIMSNHVHMLIDTDINLPDIEVGENLLINYTPLYDIMKRIKGSSARYINIALKRSGKLWSKESYDMYIRNEKMLNNVIAYILNNPVKAGIVSSWEKYNGNYYIGD